MSPPSTPYRPFIVGESVFDVRSGRWGAFMGWQQGRVYLRPLTGGVEWDTDARWISTTEQ